MLQRRGFMIAEHMSCSCQNGKNEAFKRLYVVGMLWRSRNSNSPLSVSAEVCWAGLGLDP